MIGEKLAQNWPGDASPMGDDRVLRATRITAAVLVPVLLTAGVILYLFPDDTARLFAWPMEPRPTAPNDPGGPTFLLGRELGVVWGCISPWSR